MNDGIDLNVFVSHFQKFIDNKLLSEEDEALVSLIIELAQAGFNPASTLSDIGKVKIKEITSVDLNLVKINGIDNNTSNEVVVEAPKQKILTFDEILSSMISSTTSSVQDKSACTHYSFSLNTSSNYAYANDVDHPTCSHPSVPVSSTCHYGISQHKCPLFKADVREETFVVDSHRYNIIYQRTLQAVMNIYIYDDTNLVTKLSYFMDKFRDLSSEDIKNEISLIIKEHHANAHSLNVNSLNYNFLQNDEETNNSNSYISSLIS